jgi:hypothetical protein
VNAARANGVPRGGNGLVAIPVDTGGAYRVSVRLPDRGYVAQVATPGPLATTPVNATQANGGTRGREWQPRDQDLPDRGQRLRRDAGATGHNARERDTGERREAGAAPAGSRPFVPTRKPSLAPKARGASANTCRIAANWLMLTAGPVPASRRRYRPWVTSAAWRSSGRRGNRLRREAAAIWQTLRLSLQRAVFGLSGRLGSLNQHIRRLPSHGRSPFRSCLRLVLLLARFTFGQVLVNCVL